MHNLGVFSEYQKMIIMTTRLFRFKRKKIAIRPVHNQLKSNGNFNLHVQVHLQFYLV